MAAPVDDCDCSDPRDFERCACAERGLVGERSRSKRDLTAEPDWNNSPLSPSREGIAELKRSTDGDAHALNAVFRWGKRRYGANSGDDVSAYSNVFRWGKRSPIVNYDASEVAGDGGSLEGVDNDDMKRIFRWGKRGGSSASVFRWGKRSRESGNPPVFRWGKRDYREDLSSDLGTLSLFQWPGKRIDEGQYAEQRYTPVFRWGKRQNSNRGNRRQTASLFRWGKRSVDSLQQGDDK